MAVPFSFRLADPEGRSYVEKCALPEGLRRIRRCRLLRPGLWRSYYRGGYGVYRMIVDPNTGRVVEVEGR
ncbi:hypothetical protein BH18VER1_BH18VER1_03580 [soil metagenome]